MKHVITSDQDCQLYVKSTLFPGTRLAVIVCEEFVSGQLNQANEIILMTRGEVEGVISALQKTLDIWDERNGL